MLKVDIHKGEWDFSVSYLVRNLSFKEMQDFRAMCVVALGTMEMMWREAQAQQPENQAAQSENIL